MIIPKTVQDLFNKTSLVPFGTADKNGVPNINVVYWKLIMDGETILLIDNFMKTTKTNLLENNQVCLSFWDSSTEEGYKLKGVGTYHLKGEIFNKGKEFIQQKNPDRIPRGVVEINVKEIFVLTPGLNAGNKLN